MGKRPSPEPIEEAKKFGRIEFRVPADVAEAIRSDRDLHASIRLAITRLTYTKKYGSWRSRK